MLPSLPFFFSRKKKRERENKEKERKWKQDQQSWTTLKAVQNHFIPLGRKKWRRASNMTAPGLLLLPLLLLLVQFASAVERNTWLSPRDSPRWVRRNTASFGSGPIWFLDCRAKLNDSPQKRGQRCSLPRLQACYLLRERKKKRRAAEGLAAEARNAMSHRREFVMANFPINGRERWNQNGNERREPEERSRVCALDHLIILQPTRCSSARDREDVSWYPEWSPYDDPATRGGMREMCLGAKGKKKEDEEREREERKKTVYTYRICCTAECNMGRVCNSWRTHTTHTRTAIEQQKQQQTLLESNRNRHGGSFIYTCYVYVYILNIYVFFLLLLSLLIFSLFPLWPVVIVEKS